MSATTYPDVPFRFDSAAHEYTALDTGETLVHITGMLERAGLVDSTWMTEESAARGQIVHSLAAQYDYGALDQTTVPPKYKGYLLAHVQAVSILRPEWLAIEQPHVHPRYRFGGRPDRVCVLYGQKAVLELKTAAPSKAHAIQVALQSILVADQFGLPPEAMGRFCLYWKPTGKFALEEHTRPQDFNIAYEVIRSCCG